jgi:hypothetical protein
VILRLLCLLVSFPLGATVFQVQTLDEQLKEADGIIIGHYLKSKAIKLDDGSVATQMIFKMNKEYGMQSDLFRMDEIIIHYPGGKLGDETVSVDGVPEFVSGENVALMIKSRQDRYWGLNLGMGSYKVINYGNEKIIVNSIFPNDRRLSQIKLEDFEKSVKLIKGSNLKVVLSPIYPTETDTQTVQRMPASVPEEGKNRAIASKTDTDENKESTPVINNLWLIFLLALMGGWFRLSRQKEAK